MTAKLEWKGDYLRMRDDASGLITTWGEVTRGRVDRLYYYLVNNDVAHRDGYQWEKDARQDCESEVRRLLKEAGVEVVP